MPNTENCVNDLTKIVRRDIRCHTYGDTGCTVHQKVRESCRKYNRLFLRLIEVWHEVYRIFVDISSQFHIIVIYQTTRT